MNIQWWQWLLFIWFVLIVLAALLDFSFGSSVGPIAALMDWRKFMITSPNLFGLQFTIPVPNGQFFGALGQILTFGYPMFSGDFFFIRLLLNACIGAPAGIMLVTTVGPAVASGFGTILGAVATGLRNIFG